MLTSDCFVVPVIPEFLSLQGLKMIMARIDGLKEIYKEEVAIKFAGVILNKIHLQRKDHKAWASALYYIPEEAEELRQEENLPPERLLTASYLQELGGMSYNPFYWWIGDLKPLYIITDYNYPFRTTGREKWRNHFHKYSQDYKWSRGTNPTPYGPWDKLQREGRRGYYNKVKYYYIFDRIADLINEFVRKCQ